MQEKVAEARQEIANHNEMLKYFDQAVVPQLGQDLAHTTPYMRTVVVKEATAARRAIQNRIALANLYLLLLFDPSEEKKRNEHLAQMEHKAQHGNAEPSLAPPVVNSSVEVVNAPEASNPLPPPVDANETGNAPDVSVAMGSENETKTVDPNAPRLCITCKSTEYNVVSIPCCHIALCHTCVPHLRTSSCPICRTPVQAWRRVYLV
jgi:hypothetical protein